MNAAARALQLFEQALELDPAQQPAWLDAACAGDAAVRAEVEALLRADAASGGFLAEPLGANTDRSGERIGAYRLLAWIGSGGMGSVYRAERADGAFARPVAVKLLLYDAGDLRHRFAREQRILGALSHAHIAALLDVGHDSNGAPYLVMEFVEGQPLTTYASQHRLDVRTRLALFLKILDAVQAAHGQLIVHRDIKPNNVLVDHQGEPKLLDFGIAKLVGDASIDSPLTRTGLGPLTPEYASPEQVRGEPLGTASDIYSLGVLLFELVTGTRPYRIADTRPSTIERIVCESEPPRPSAQLSTRQLGGSARDLDALILKALAKQPARRYASCASFAEDIRRWLAGTPVLARQPPLRELSARWLRRHRFAVSVATAAILALLVGSGFALWQAHEARLARDRAERINLFLTGMLAAADPGDLGRKVTVVAVLDRAQRQAERELADDPLSATGTELTLARTFTALGDLDGARHAGELALDAARRTGDRRTVIDAQIRLGTVFIQRGEHDAAEKLLRLARDGALDHGSALQRGQAASEYGSLESARSHFHEAETWFRTALAELPADADSERAETLNDLAIVESNLGDDTAALKLHEQTVQMLQRVYPHGHPQLAEALRNLGDSQYANGLKEQSRINFNAGLEMQIDLLGPNHQSVVSTLSSMTNVDLMDNQSDAALEHGARAWAAAQHLSEENPVRAYAAVMYGQALLRVGRTHEAVGLIDIALTLRRAALAPDHPLVVNTESVLALAQALSGDRAAGEKLARSAYERQRDKLGEKHFLTESAKQRLEQIEALPQPVTPLSGR